MHRLQQAHTLAHTCALSRIYLEQQQQQHIHKCGAAIHQLGHDMTCLTIEQQLFFHQLSASSPTGYDPLHQTRADMQ